MRVIVGVLLFLTLTSVMAEIGDANAQRQAQIGSTSFASIASSVLSRLQQTSPTASITTNLLKRWSRQSTTALGAPAQVICPVNQEQGHDGRCICKSNSVMVSGSCEPCPEQSGTIGENRSGWSDCVCNRGYTGLVTNALAECKPCDIDFYGVNGKCLPCPPLASTFNATGSGSCACLPSNYGSGSSCQPCPAGSTSLRNSLSVSSCTCIAAKHVLEAKDGQYVCTPADQAKHPMKHFHSLISHSADDEQSPDLCYGHAPCYYANRVRVLVRWLQAVISMYSQTYGLFLRPTLTCPTWNEIIALVVPAILNSFDLATDLLMKPVVNVGFHGSYVVFGLAAAFYDWRGLVVKTHNSKNNVVLVDHMNHPHWAILKKDCKEHNQQCEVVLLDSCDASSVFDSCDKPSQTNDAVADKKDISQEQLEEQFYASKGKSMNTKASLVDVLHSHFLRTAPFYLALSCGLFLVYVAATDNDEIEAGLQLALILLCLAACVGGNNLYYAIMFGNEQPVWASTVLNVLAGITAILTLSNLGMFGLYIILPLFVMATIFPLIIVGTTQSKVGCSYKSSWWTLMVIVGIWGPAVGLATAAAN